MGRIFVSLLLVTTMLRGVARPPPPMPLPEVVGRAELVLLVEEEAPQDEDALHDSRGQFRGRVMDVVAGPWTKEFIEYRFNPFVYSGRSSGCRGFGHPPYGGKRHVLLFFDDIEETPPTPRLCIIDEPEALRWIAERVRSFAKEKDRSPMKLRDWLIGLLDGPASIREIAMSDLVDNRYVSGEEGSCEPPFREGQQARIRAAFVKRPTTGSSLRGFVLLAGDTKDDAFDEAVVKAIDEAFSNPSILEDRFGQIRTGLDTIIMASQEMKHRLGLKAAPKEYCQRSRYPSVGWGRAREEWKVTREAVLARDQWIGPDCGQR